MDGDIIYKYTDEEFMEKVNDKIGNVRQFKKHLRKRGLIGNRQQLSEEHVQMFNEVREYKKTHHTTWEIAFKLGLKAVSKQHSSAITSNFVIAETPQTKIEETLIEILETLRRIEEKL